MNNLKFSFENNFAVIDQVNVNTAVQRTDLLFLFLTLATFFFFQAL